MKNMHDENNVIIVPLTSNLQDNIDAYEVIFDKCADVVKRKFTIGDDHKVEIYLSYIDLLIDRDLLEEHTIESLVRNTDHIPAKEQFDYIYNHGFQTADVALLYTMEDIVQAVLAGDAILMVEGSNLGIKVAIRGYPGRGVSEADTEVTIRGAKDSFTESMAINKVLIRRRIRDSKLKVEQLKVGQRSRTDIGGLIIGDAAVSANIVSPIIVIIVALTAVSSFTIPNEIFSTAFRITRYLLIILSAWLGIYGLITGIALTLMHLSSLESFGVPYLMPYVASGMEGEEDSRDGLIRLPTKRLYRRPVYSKKEEKIRLKQKQ